MITITVPGVPVAQPRQRMANIGGFLKNYTPTRDPVNAWKCAVQLAWRVETKGLPIEGPVRLSVAFVMPRPKYMDAKKYSGKREWYNRTPDLDNCIKALKDALNTLAWKDDSQVCQVYATKEYASAWEHPHAVVEVGHVGEKTQ